MAFTRKVEQRRRYWRVRSTSRFATAERPVHGVSLNVEVWREPTVKILPDRHAYTRVKAGDTFTREIVIENAGDQAVPVNPQLNSQENRHRHRYPEGQETLDRSWFEIDGPNEIEPGEPATVVVAVSPSADAERGEYRGPPDLGLKDPTSPERSAYWQEVTRRFQVWPQPEEPYETSFEVSEDAQSITLELSAGSHHRDTNEMAPPSFDVTFVAPNGDEIAVERVGVTTRGSVNLGADCPQTATDDSTYSARGEQHTFRYRIQNPENGTWSVQITPDNAMRFDYELIREEA